MSRYNKLSPDIPVEVEASLVDAVLAEVEVGRVALGGVPRGHRRREGRVGD